MRRTLPRRRGDRLTSAYGERALWIKSLSSRHRQVADARGSVHVWSWCSVLLQEWGGRGRSAATLRMMKTATPSSRLAELIASYTLEVARAFTIARRKMRAFVPRGYELVYENYNALGIGYGVGQKSTDAILSIVAYPRWITLFFLYGATLKDPSSLLVGAGSRVRSIRLQSPDDLDRPDIRLLIAQALAPYADALARCPRLRLVVKSTASRRRPRRPAPRKPSQARAK
jgi:hypothetical protein